MMAQRHKFGYTEVDGLQALKLLRRERDGLAALKAALSAQFAPRS